MELKECVNWHDCFSTKTRNWMQSIMGRFLDWWLYSDDYSVEIALGTACLILIILVIYLYYKWFRKGKKQCQS